MFEQKKLTIKNIDDSKLRVIGEVEDKQEIKEWFDKFESGENPGKVTIPFNLDIIKRDLDNLSKFPKNVTESILIREDGKLCIF